MRSSSVVLVVLVASWVAATEAIFLLAGAVTLGGLAALKGAFLLSAAKHHYHKRYYNHNGRHYWAHKRYGRAIQSASDDGENLLLSTVGQLDPNGCIPKMLCHLQTMEEGTRTLEEDVLVDMFGNGTEKLTTYNAAFVYASDIGSRTRNSTICDKNFPKCPLSNTQLSVLLQQAWGCGSDLFEADAQNEEDPASVDQEDHTSAPGQTEIMPLVDQQ